jgi:acetate---CoA ligase (ADP-forming)
MKTLFYPRSVVIFGVSESPRNLGRNICINLDRFLYSGKIYLVGPRPGYVGNYPIYLDLKEIEDLPDLAIFITPATTIPGLLEQCGKKGIRWAVIESAGFGESSEQGEILEKKIVQVAKTYGIRFVGPNCVGLMNLDTGLILPFVTLNPKMTRKGPISLISQSGGVATCMMKMFSLENLGFNKFISIGNKLNLNENKYLDYFINDPETEIIGLYLENISEGRKLVELAISTEKPIVTIKANTTKASEEVARFHTTALAGDDRLCDAAFREGGIHRVQSYADFLDHLKVFRLPPMRGKNLVMIGRSGGQMVISADAAFRYGFSLPKLPRSLLEAIKGKVRSGVIQLTNPLDLGDLFDMEFYLYIIESVLKEEMVHAVLLQQTYTKVAGIGDPQKPIVAANALSRKYKKPIILCAVTDRDEWLQMKTATEFPIFSEAEGALKALAASLSHYQRKLSDKGLMPIQSGVLPPAENRNDIFEVLKGMGLVVPDFRWVKDSQESTIAGRLMGYPVALKIFSKEVIHKSDKKGVKLNIMNEDALKFAFSEMSSRFKLERSKEEKIFLVQRMAPSGFEMILGAKRDPEFGPIVLLGIGGVFVEIFDDVAFRLAPVSEQEALSMVNEIKASSILQGVRGQQNFDIEALSRSVADFSKAFVTFSGVKEIEINPLFVLERGHGCLAVDGRMRVAP